MCILILKVKSIGNTIQKDKIRSVTSNPFLKNCTHPERLLLTIRAFFLCSLSKNRKGCLKGEDHPQIHFVKLYLFSFSQNITMLLLKLMHLIDVIPWNSKTAIKFQ